MTQVAGKCWLWGALVLAGGRWGPAAPVPWGVPGAASPSPEPLVPLIPAHHRLSAASCVAHGERRSCAPVGGYRAVVWERGCLSRGGRVQVPGLVSQCHVGFTAFRVVTKPPLTSEPAGASVLPERGFVFSLSSHFALRDSRAGAPLQHTGQGTRRRARCRGSDLLVPVWLAGHREDHEHGPERAAGAGAAEHSQAGSRRGAGHAGAPQEPPAGRRQLRARQSSAHHPHPGPRRRHAAQQQLHRRDDDHLQTGAIGPAGWGTAAAPPHAPGAPCGAAPLQQQQQLGGGQPRHHPHREAVPQRRGGQVGHHVAAVLRSGEACRQRRQNDAAVGVQRGPRTAGKLPGLTAMWQGGWQICVSSLENARYT